MKSLIAAVAAAAVLAVPAVSFAQQANAPVTRAQVRSELVQLEKVGYNPGFDRVNYPEDIQAAQARLQGSVDNSGYGPQAAPVVRAGSPAAAGAHSARDSIFFGQ